VSGVYSAKTSEQVGPNLKQDIGANVSSFLSFGFFVVVKRLSVRGEKNVIQSVLRGRASNFFHCRFFLLRFWALLDVMGTQKRD
jgi:hypothetical protein